MITGGGGNDTIDGGDGEDVAVYTGDRYSYITENNDGTKTVSALMVPILCRILSHCNLLLEPLQRGVLAQ